MQEIVSLLLKKEGYNTIQKNNGLEALEHLENNLPDLIISDYYMTDMGGLDMLKIIRHSYNKKNIPFIFLTGDTVYNIKKYLNNSFNVFDILLKPINKKMLLNSTYNAFA